MNMENVDARLTEIERRQSAHRMLLTIILAEFTVSNDGMRGTLEDLLAQAEEAREIHLPLTTAEAMPDIYRITRDLLADVSKQISVPLCPRLLGDKR